ncbi:hypothetical protein BDIM_08560 [Brevundimonas diminuta ATCC 11568]|nr:hypothetical protein BDIM_08560 [Brevundimonas diminuta ATCC 11568]
MAPGDTHHHDLRASCRRPSPAPTEQSSRFACGLIVALGIVNGRGAALSFRLPRLATVHI